jgi:hypothetical protein
MSDVESVPLLNDYQKPKSKKKYGYYISAAVLLLGVASIGCALSKQSNAYFINKEIVY